MATVTLRFNGRFAFAQSRRANGETGTISVIAPRFEPSRFGHHQPSMTIRHGHVKFSAKSAKRTVPVTTLDPLLRVTDPAVHRTSQEAADPQLLIWDLSGLHVGFQGKGPVQLIDDAGAAVLNLEELEAVQGRPNVKLDAQALRPSRNGKTHTVIEITAGRGIATASAGIEVQFASEANVVAGRPTLVRRPQSNDLLTKVPAEVVEFTVPCDNHATAGDPAFLTLNCANGDGTAVGLVSVVEGAVVTFSNACAKIGAPPDFDLEFSRYYDLLTTSQAMDGLIPCDLTGLAESVPCYVASSVTHDL